MLETIGWIGTICMCICGIPQAIQSIRDKHSDGLTWGLTILLWVGCVALGIYSVGQRSIPLIMNYFLTGIVASILLYYKIWPTRSKHHSVENGKPR